MRGICLDHLPEPPKARDGVSGETIFDGVGGIFDFSVRGDRMADMIVRVLQGVGCRIEGSGGAGNFLGSRNSRAEIQDATEDGRD